MLLRVEYQREVSLEGVDSLDSAVMQVRTGNRREFATKSGQQRGFTDKRGLQCSNCNRTGHTKDTCFKLRGTPDWYRELIERRKKEDLATDKIIVVGKVHRDLYILDKSSFHPAALTSLSSLKGTLPIESVVCNNALWHRSLGHPSLHSRHIDLSSSLQNSSQSHTRNVLENGPDTSNRVVERKHRHILVVARALSFQAHLPTKFWGESVHAATHVINRLSSRLLNWKSPYEILFHKVPNYSSLKVFGCLYFASNTSPSKCKFTPPAPKCVFLGYSQNHKGYKVFDLDTDTLFHSRDVIFHENIFPFEPTISVASPPSTDYVPSYFDDDDHSLPHPTSITSTPPSTSSPPSAQSPSVSQDSLPMSSVPLDELPLSTFPVPEQRRSLRTIHKPTSPKDYEPRAYADASRDEHWVAAMNEEIAALERNSTWTPVPRPPSKKAIGCRWVFKLKRHPDGSVLRHKARLVAKGYNQIEGVDYFDSFSPVAKVVTVRIFLAVAVHKGWPLWKLGVNNAFLHGHLDEKVFMMPPQGYKMVVPNLICRLHRSLYGLKQASRQWNIELTTRLQAFGYSQCPHDHCLFLKITDSCFVALFVYVDDILLTGDSTTDIDALKAHLHSLFTIKDLGLAKYFLGLEFARSSHGLLVTQQKYLRDILADTNMLGSKATPTPLPPGLKLSADVGPDVSFAVQQLSQFLQHPKSSHWDAAVHVLHYLKGSSSLRIFFSSRSTLHPLVDTDASWASCPDSRRSIFGYCIFLGSSLVSWRMKKQATVSRSSAEAEHRSMGAAMCELLWLSYLLRAFKIQFRTPIPF
ncbi:UNVERIFIED_CONTAM: Retrovirus-related Pol polyprotein from transposon RE1 [Sesamum indicum]